MLINKIEYENKQWIEFNFTFQCVLGFIFALTLIMAFFSARLYWDSEAIKSDPLVYGAKIYDVNYCYCIENNNVGFVFNQSTVWSTTKLIPEHPELLSTEFNESLLNFAITKIGE